MNPTPPSSLFSLLQQLGFALLLLGNSSSIHVTAFDAFVPTSALHKTPTSNVAFHYALSETQLFSANPRKEDRFQLKQAGTTLSEDDIDESFSVKGNKASSRRDETNKSAEASSSKEQRKSDPVASFLVVALLMTGALAVSSPSIETATLFNGMLWDSSSFLSPSSGMVDVTIQMEPFIAGVQTGWTDAVQQVQASLQHATLFQGDAVKNSFGNLQESLSTVSLESTIAGVAAFKETAIDGVASMQSSTVQFSKDTIQSVADIPTTVLPQAVSMAQGVMDKSQTNLGQSMAELQMSTMQATNGLASAINNIWDATSAAQAEQASSFFVSLKMGTVQAAQGFQESLAKIPPTVSHGLAGAISDLKMVASHLKSDVTTILSNLKGSTFQTANIVQQTFQELQTSIPSTIDHMTSPTTMHAFQEGLAKSASNTEIAISKSVHDIQDAVTASIQSAQQTTHVMGDQLASFPQEMSKNVQQTIMEIKASPQVSALKLLLRQTFPPLSEIQQAIVNMIQYLSLKVAAVRDVVTAFKIQNVANNFEAPTMTFHNVASQYVNDLQDSIVQTQSLLEDSKNTLDQTLSNAQPVMTQVQQSAVEPTSTVQEISSVAPIKSILDTVEEATTTIDVSASNSILPSIEVPSPPVVDDTVARVLGPQVDSQAAMDRLEKLLLDN